MKPSVLFLQDFQFKSEALQNLYEQFLAFAPKVAMALLLLLIGWIIARLISRVLHRLFRRIKLDERLDALNQIDFIAKANIKLEISKWISKIVYYIIFLLFVVGTVDTLGLEGLSDLIGEVLNYLPKFFSGFIVLIVGLLIANFIKNIVLTAAKSIGISSASLIANFIFYFLLLNVLMIAINQIGVDTEFLKTNLIIIFAGVVVAFSVGYGAGSVKLMSNYLASFYGKGKFNMGDIIKIGQVTGTVVDKDNTSLTLQTSDGRKVVFPRSLLTSTTVEIIKEKHLFSEEDIYSEEE